MTVPFSLHVAGHLPLPIPRRFQELLVDDFHDTQVLGAFAARLIVNRRTRQGEQHTLAAHAHIRMIMLNRFLPPVPRMRLEASAKKSRSTTSWPILACSFSTSFSEIGGSAGNLPLNAEACSRLQLSSSR
jgi:hypothetical protein